MKKRPAGKRTTSASQKKQATNSPSKSASKKKKSKSVQPVLDSDGGVASPVTVQDNDPGDETQRRYRYQNAYGLILLVASLRGELPYKSIWCEFHDDFLASINGKFDSYQVKTSFPELGPWELTSEGFIAAVQKFVELEQKFPGKINRYKFVSNTKCSKSQAKDKIHRSPVLFLVAIGAAATFTDLTQPFNKSIASLAEACGVAPAFLFGILQRTDLVNGPGLDDFEAVISNDHLAKLDLCGGLLTSQINSLRDELIQRLYDASSNRVADSRKHWCCVNGKTIDDPRISYKNVSSDVIAEIIRQKHPVTFRFSPISTITDKRISSKVLSKFDKKLVKGNLYPQLETMRRRTLSAEQHLLVLAAKRPSEIQAIRNQLESFVQGVCDDAHLQNMRNQKVSGPEMLIQVQKKLEKTANDDPGMVCGQSYECLVGMAGLLTESCSVWWSEKFDLDQYDLTKETEA